MNNTIRNNIIEFGGPVEEHYCDDGMMDFESQNTPRHLSDYCSDAWNLQSTSLWQSALTYSGMDPNIPQLLHDSASSYSALTNAQQDMYSSASLCTSPHVELSFSCQQESHASRIPCGALLSFGGPVSSVDVPQSSRTRIRWTPGLHDMFVECVNCLGGADKATPKEIVKLMNTQGLTSFHVKSHLQKYRIANQMPEPTPGKSGGSSSMNDMKQLHKKTGNGLEDALELQLDVQRHLHQQLEIQRNMQLRIEEQGRQLKIMLEQQQEMQKALQEDWSRSC